MSVALLGLGLLGLGLLSRGRRAMPGPGRAATATRPATPAPTGGRWRWSQASLEKRATLDPALQLAVDVMLAESDVDLTIVVGHRSDDVQAQLYAQGRTAPGNIVTYKKPGTSRHNLPVSLAVDLAPMPGGRLSWDEAEFARFGPLVDKAAAVLRERGLLQPGEQLGWGGRWKSFKDWPHVELTGGRYG